ncbi:hypothetical protein K461DRAFT_318638 [Myriangium duriaei CBS 260.36]|uniref:Uncharacterized protein n=1 Tax=Myriangium duriaei CBS 260.36 TaxID=1168546 RepID=A0A9P4J6J2_9PEZI|nr:hypothetical protein K461DRAFT_318638 [Myriangium duriaei CBS 260.36]
MVISRTDISRNDVESLNAAIDRIRKVIPDQPYIQTIPQDGSRWDHHHRESARVWRGQVPFERDERPDLQYQTFYYHEHGTDLIHLRIHSPPPEPRQARATGSEAPGSSTATPKHGPKKKISLADYKNHKTKGASVEESGKSNSIDGNLEGVREETPKPSRHDKAETQTRDFADSQGAASLKRKRSHDRTSHVRPPRESQDDISRRRRPSPEPERTERRERSRSPASSRKRKNAQAQPESLPLPVPLSPLQPLIPGRLSPLGNLLPDMLSPNLPSNIVAELERRAQLRTTSDATRSPSGAPQKPSHRDNSDMSKPNGADRDKQSGKSLLTNIQPPHSHDSPRPRPETETVKYTQSADTPLSDEVHVKAERSERPKLIVKFKIPKRLRLDYRRLLQFKPRPASRISQDGEAARKVQGRDATAAATSSERREDAETVTRGSKLAHRDDDAATKKRRRLSPSPSPQRKHEISAKKSVKNTTTPLQAPFQSPPLPSRQLANNHATPSSKKVTGTAMTRMSSTDGHAPSSTTATPASTTSVAAVAGAGVRPSPSVAPSQATVESEAWSAESNRLLDLGKTLKAAARQHEKHDSVLSLLTNIESLCAFMLSFHATDMNYRTQKPALHLVSVRRTWMTLHGFWKFVWDRAGEHPALKAAVGGLGMVYLARICTWAAANSKEREKEGIEAASMLSRVGSGPRTSLAAARKLWPETWKKYLTDGDEDVSIGTDNDDLGRPGKYAGPLELPVGIQTPTLRAIRTTLSMLGEWKTNDHGKPFQPTLKLVKRV